MKRDEQTCTDVRRPGRHSYFQREENSERSSFPRKSNRRPAIKAYILSLPKLGSTEQRIPVQRNQNCNAIAAGPVRGRIPRIES